MFPTLDHGDYIVAIKRFRSDYKIDDIVIVEHKIFGEIIKRICTIDAKGNSWLAGDGSDTLSTERMGPIAPSQIRAKMRWHIAP